MPALPARLLEHLAVLMLAHLLAPLLDNVSHALPIYVCASARDCEKRAGSDEIINEMIKTIGRMSFTNS